MPHLIDIQSLSASQIEQLLLNAQHYLDYNQRPWHKIAPYHSMICVNLFFEHSTRTLNSFQIAQQRHGMMVLTPHLDTSSLGKGESIDDMGLNLEAMGARLFVMRHSDSQAVWHFAKHLKSTSVVINAGSGISHHPTQALIDLLTIRQHKHDFSKQVIAIIGDCIHSRVARSLITGLTILDALEIRIIAPRAWCLNEVYEQANLVYFSDIKAGLQSVDVIVCLRVQKERMSSIDPLVIDDFQKHYQLTPERLSYALSDAIILHPGPINRGVEIASSLIDSQQSVILNQVKNSVAVRMAAMDFVLEQSREK